MSEPRPMDRDRLGALRRGIHPVTHPDFSALLAAHDYWRSRARVTEADVQAQGVTANKALRYCMARGWKPRDEVDEEELARANWALVCLVEPGSTTATSLFNGTRDAAASVACTCIIVADAEGRASQDVLDEMAAMEVE